MAKLTVRLDFTSRLRKTSIYSKKGKPFFGVWKKPEIQLDGDEKVITISLDQEGFLDIIAYEEYGDRAWWWAIASVNKIANVNDEIVAGKALIIPKLDNIRDAVQEQRDAESI